MFELNVPDNYTVQNWQENDFINNKNSEADLAKYGKTYSVQFEGNADTYLWTTKTQPEHKSTYYGHIQATSGKMQRFKVDKQDDAKPQQTGSTSITGQSTDESKQNSIELQSALKQAVEYAIANKMSPAETLGVADIWLAWFKKHTSTQLPTELQAPRPSEAGESKRDWASIHKPKEIIVAEPDEQFPEPDYDNL